MAKLYNFSVDIIPESGNVNIQKDHGSYYCEMPKDNVQYTIFLKNTGSDRCDAVVSVDGKEMGTFRINRYSSIKLERPADIDRKFTFFVGGSSGSYQGGYTPKDKNNGLVEVVFKPEKNTMTNEATLVRKKCRYTPESRLYDGNGDGHKESFFESENLCCRSFNNESISSMAAVPTSSSSSRNYQEGMTALTGSSSQKFTSVNNLDYDRSKEVTILLRLVYSERRPEIEPLQSVSQRRTGYPNPV